MAIHTSYETRGGWADEGGKLWEEAPLAYVLFDAEEEDVKAIMDEVLEKLNQSVVLMEKDEGGTAYETSR